MFNSFKNLGSDPDLDSSAIFINIFNFFAHAGCTVQHYSHCIDISSLYGLGAYAFITTVLLSLAGVRMVRRRGRGNGNAASTSTPPQLSQGCLNVFYIFGRLFYFAFSKSKLSCLQHYFKLMSNIRKER